MFLESIEYEMFLLFSLIDNDNDLLSSILHDENKSL